MNRIGILIILLWLVTLFVAIPAGRSQTAHPEGAPSEAQAYVGTRLIADTEAYQQFCVGSGSETQKLYYLLERFKNASDCDFFFMGSRYSAQDVYFAGNWLLEHRYKTNQDARSFLKEQVSLFESPTAPLLIKLPDGSRHHAYSILLNELELLESSVGRNISVRV